MHSEYNVIPAAFRALHAKTQAFLKWCARLRNRGAGAFVPRTACRIALPNVHTYHMFGIWNLAPVTPTHERLAGAAPATSGVPKKE